MDAVIVPGSFAEMLGRLLLATLLGGLIGLNRESQGKPAGLRTHALVALGAAILTIVGLLLQQSDSGAPSRVVQGLVAGVGFIGAGVILHRSDGAVEGLTTAAAIWMVSAVGVAAGAGLWRTAASAVVVGLLLLVVGETVDRWVHREKPKA